MCFPLVGAILSVAQSLVSFAAAQADYEAKAEQWRTNYTNALAAGRDEQQQLTLRMSQEDAAKSQKLSANSVEAAEVSAEANASAASAGLSGISLDNIMNGIRRKRAEKDRVDLTNHMMTTQQLQKEMDATNTRIEGRINSVQRPVAPNPLGYILQGVGGALRAV